MMADNFWALKLNQSYRPHLKMLVCRINASSSQLCGCIFLLSYIHLNLALLLHKQGLVATGVATTVHLVMWKRSKSGPLEPCGKVWQLPYQHLRNLLLSATFCHTNILEIYLNLPRQWFRASNGPAEIQGFYQHKHLSYPLAWTSPVAKITIKVHLYTW